MTYQNHMMNDLIKLMGKNPSQTEIKAYCVMKNLNFEDVVKEIETYKEAKPKAEHAAYIPKKDKNYVAFGNYSDVKKIIESKLFYPFFITGLSGNGKTMSVEQACANLKREMILFPVTAETDEDDLLGSYTLQDGNTVFNYGPVVEAMRNGSILLLDEIDYATSKISCIQSVLAGSPLYLKKTGETIEPKEGFNIIATANTKGRGSSDGKFVGTNIMNEAFLERFAITFEQAYPTASVEKKILMKHATTLKIQDEEPFISKLVEWGQSIRKLYSEDGIDEVITTRRLVNILKTYAIFKNKAKALKLSISRFDEDTITTFIEYYDKLDEDFDKSSDVEEQVEEVLV